MLMKNGSPQVFYHGTNVEFDIFRPLSHFGDGRIAKKMAEETSAKREVLSFDSFIGMDNTTKSDLDWRTLDKKMPVVRRQVIPAHLKMNNPVLLPMGSLLLYEFKLEYYNIALNRHLGVNSLVDHVYRQTNDANVATDLFFQLYENVPFLQEFRFVFDDPKTCPYDIVKKELALETLYPVFEEDNPYAEQKNREHLIVQRMIRSFESMGYDGALYSSGGGEKPHDYAIIFRPESVERLDKEVVFPKRKFAAQKEAALDKIKADRLRDMVVEPLTPEQVSVLLMCELNRSDREFKYEYNRYYWTDFALRKVMPEIAKITNQSKFGYHGLEHTEQVVLYGIQYALSENVRPLPVILACALHDCARTDDMYDEVHGPNCAPIARKFLAANRFDLTDTEMDQVVDAIINHTTGRKAPNGISACLWDADRTRLSWENGYAPQFFSTQTAKKVASLDERGQNAFLEEQRCFLQAHPEWNSVLVQSAERWQKLSWWERMGFGRGME